LAKKEQKYDSSSIEVFEGLEGVRRHPGMYLGALGTQGHHQCFKELADNAKDEVTAARRGERRIHVYVNEKARTVIVADTGRGIPVDVHKKTKLSGIETVMTRLHAGAKSGKSSADSAYGKNKVGVHGVGASVVNALSNLFEVWTRRDGSWHYIAFEGGVTKKKLVRVKRLPHDVRPPGKWPNKGTIVRYSIDEKLLSGHLDPTGVAAWCDLTRYFSPVTISLSVDGGQKKVAKTFEPKTPVDLLRRRMKRLELTADYDPILVKADGVRLVMTWTGGGDSTVLGSVSASPTSGGTHMRGLEFAVREAFAKATKRAGKKVRIDPTIGMFAVLDVSIDQPSFEGQDKDRLASKAAYGLVRDAVLPALRKWVRKNKEAVKKIVEHAREINRIDVEASNKKKAARETRQKGGRLSMPRGFKAASSFPADRRETYLVEGNSAGGTAKMACMPWQEILPLRGKIANVIRDGSKALTNDVVQGIITVAGYDLRNPQRRLRTGKLVLLTDADHDGDHITVLLLTVIYKVMPELIAQGRVFVVDAPLFEAQSGDEVVLGNSLAEMQKLHGKVTKVNRMKGWGSCDAPLLKRVAFSPDTRRLLRVSAPTPAEGKEFELLMGDSSEGRKKLLKLQ